MNVISAQISLYPLRQNQIASPIGEVVRALQDRGLTVRIGTMSTLVWGEESLLFTALHEAFHRAAEYGDAVMTVTISNACPMPQEL